MEALYEAKWPEGYCCARCGHRHASVTRTRRLPLYECLNCRYQASLISGTVMEGSRTPLHKWFKAIYLLACSGWTNAVKLASIIEVTYKTAWLIMHKIRFIMSQSNSKELLTGIVHVKASVYGKPYNPTIYRHASEHPLLAGASINDSGEITRLKIVQVRPEHLSDKYILRSGTNDFVARHVTSSTTDLTIETKRYNLRGYQPLLLRCKEASNWMNDVYHGIGPKHLQVYLDEFCYRLNDMLRNESSLWPLFKQCASTSAITYKKLTRPKPQYSHQTRPAAA